MDTAARWPAPESPIWLLDSERKSKAQLNRRPWETKQDEDKISAVIRGSYNIDSLLGYTFAICAAPSSPIQLNARLSDKRFLLADLVVERADPIRRAPSFPMRLFLRDRWVRLDQRNNMSQACLCSCLCVNVNQCLIEPVWWLTCCLQREGGGSSSLEEGCPPMSQL